MSKRPEPLLTKQGVVQPRANGLGRLRMPRGREFVMLARKRTTNESLEILELLNKALQLEYSLVVHYPRIASAISDDKTRELTLALGTDSVRHADIVANAVSSLGGSPAWAFEPFPLETDLVRLFRGQLEKEQQALRLHEESAIAARDGSLRLKLARLATDEERHIHTVKEILSRLQSQPI